MVRRCACWFWFGLFILSCLGVGVECKGGVEGWLGNVAGCWCCGLWFALKYEKEYQLVDR